MKEAAGEANMTVVTIVLIAIVLGVGTIIVTNMMGSMQGKTACAEAGGAWNPNTKACLDENGNTITLPDGK